MVIARFAHPFSLYMHAPSSRRAMATRRALVLLIVGVLFLPTLHVNAAPIGGTLTGKVVMKTGGAAFPAAPLTVTLLYFNPGYFRVSEESADFRTTMTAPDGSFTFAGLDTTASGIYRVVVRYKGIDYEPVAHDVADVTGLAGGSNTSRAVRFENNVTTATTEIAVYEPVVADASATYTIKSHQIIMNEVRPQFYSVLEALQLTNPGDRTLVGALAPDGSMAQGVPIPLTSPAGAQSLTTSRIDLIPGADVTGQKLTLCTAIQPGASDLTATYDLPGTPNGLSFKRTLDAPAAKVEALVSDSRQAIVSQTLKDNGPIQVAQGATSFRRFSLDNAQAGQQIDLMIGPSPAAPVRGAVTPAQKSVLDRIRENATVPLLLTLALICLGLMALILRMPARSTNGKSSASDTDEPAETATKPTIREPRTSTSRTRGRPHDYDVDEADREIERANAATPDEPPKRD